MSKFQAGDVLRPLGRDGRCIVMCLVTPEEYHRRGVNAPCPGLYGFGGMWYGDDPRQSASFGKIYDPERFETWERVGSVDDFTIEKLKELVN